jgi:hypothetical protein
MNRPEPWRRFEAHVDPDGLLPPAERTRRAKISYRAFTRANAKKATRSRLAAKHRREAALRRKVAAEPSPADLAEFAARAG